MGSGTVCWGSERSEVSAIVGAFEGYTDSRFVEFENVGLLGGPSSGDRTVEIALPFGGELAPFASGFIPIE